MFFDNLQRICQDKEIAVTRALKEAGIAPSLQNYWKTNYLVGIDSTPTTQTLKKLTKYLGCTKEDLLGEGEQFVMKRPVPSALMRKIQEYYRNKKEN